MPSIVWPRLEYIVASLWTTDGILTEGPPRDTLLMLRQQGLTSAIVAQTFHDPSPAAFIGTLSAFTLAALYAHYIHRDDRYQNAFLVGSACVVIFLSSAICILSPDARWLPTIRIYLPLAIVLGSSLSAVVHRSGVLDRASGGNQHLEQGREKVQLGNEVDREELS